MIFLRFGQIVDKLEIVRKEFQGFSWALEQNFETSTHFRSFFGILGANRIVLQRGGKLLLYWAEKSISIDTET